MPCCTLSYVVVFIVMSFHIMSCYIVLHYITLSYHIKSCCYVSPISYDVILYHCMLCHVISYHIILLYHVMLYCYIMSCVILCHVLSIQVILCHIVMLSYVLSCVIPLTHVTSHCLHVVSQRIVFLCAPDGMYTSRYNSNSMLFHSHIGHQIWAAQGAKKKKKSFSWLPQFPSLKVGFRQ